MKRFVFVTITIFLFAFSIFGQSPCPSISVTGPSGITAFGDSMTFTGSLSEEAKNYKIEYLWTVSGGKIVEGQGTNIIKVLSSETGETTTAVMEIKGLPADCPSMGTASVEIVCILPRLRKIDEFSVVLTQIRQEKLQILIKELQDDPTSRIYIFERFKCGTSSRAIEKRISDTYSYLTKILGADSSRIEWQIFEGDKDLTEFWLVPVGADAPSSGEGKFRISGGNFKEELDRVFPKPKKKSLSKRT